MIQKIAVTVLSAVSVLALSNAALADYQMLSGGGTSRDGNDYAYELWSNDQNTTYMLKIWLRNNYPKGSNQTFRFSSSQAAIDYFDCNYAQKSLPSCPK